MSIPSPAKTWQFSYGGGSSAVNLYSGGGSVSFLAARQEILFRIKSILTGVAAGAWTVVASSDSSSAGTSDKWVAASNLVWGSSAHSWIVLKQTGIGANFQICFDLASATSSGYMHLYVSAAAGFSGFSSTTTRPTAVDEIQVVNNLRWLTDAAALVPLILHGMVSTDGECSRFFVCTQGFVTGVMMFEKVATSFPASTTWPVPFVALSVGANAVPEVTGTALFDTINGYHALNYACFSRCEPLGRFPMIFAGDSQGHNPGMIAVTAGQAQSDLTLESPLSTVSVGSHYGLVRGRHGKLQDIWVGHRYLFTGETYPADATRTLAQFGMLVVPWNGSVVKTG